MNIDIQKMQAFEEYESLSRKVKALDEEMMRPSSMHNTAEFQRLSSEMYKTRMLLKNCKERLCAEFLHCVDECVTGIHLRDALENYVVETKKRTVTLKYTRPPLIGGRY